MANGYYGNTPVYTAPAPGGGDTGGGFGEPAGQFAPPAGTQVTIGGKIFEYGGTPGISPHLVGDAPPSPWESATPEPSVGPFTPEIPDPYIPGGEQEQWPRYEFPQISMPGLQYPSYTPGQLPQTLAGQTSAYTPQPLAPASPSPPRIDWMAEAQKLLGQADIQDIIRDLESGLGPIRNTLQQLLAISPEDIEKRYQAEIETPAQRYYQEQTLPSLRRSFVGPGTFWSSMKGQAEQRSGARLGEALMGERSRMYGQARQEALGAAGQAQQVEQQAFAGRTYPYEMALKGAPLGVEQRGQEMTRDVNLRAQDLQQEIEGARSALTQRAQDLQRYLEESKLGYMGETERARLEQQSAMHQSNINLQLEQLRQRERELWGYLNPLESAL